jgi:hypothetical protein
VATTLVAYFLCLISIGNRKFVSKSPITPVVALASRTDREPRPRTDRGPTDRPTSKVRLFSPSFEDSTSILQVSVSTSLPFEGQHTTRHRHCPHPPISRDAGNPLHPALYSAPTPRPISHNPPRRSRSRILRRPHHRALQGRLSQSGHECRADDPECLEGGVQEGLLADQGVE